MLKLPLYAAAGVGHAWLVDPVARTLEVFTRNGSTWTLTSAHRDDAIVHAPPFEAFALELGVLWEPFAPAP